MAPSSRVTSGASRLLLLLVAATWLLAQPSTCMGASSQPVNPSNPLRVSFPLVGASFDLRRLRDPAMSLAPGERHGFYNVLDTSFVTGIASANYSYLFNVGGVVPSPSRALCGSRADSPVWQVRPPFSTDASWKPTGCARVANTVADATWSLLDERDPSKGLTLTYLGGQECHSTKTNRTFTINFICADPTPDPALESMVNESPSNRCTYEAEMITSYACPLECSRTGGGLCNGDYCAFDASIGRPRCFCRKGMFGPECTATSSGSTECTGLCLILAFAVSLLGVLLVVGGLALWQIQRVVTKQRAMGLSRPKHGSSHDAQPSPDALSLSLDTEHSGNGQNDGAVHRGSSGGAYGREDSSGGGGGGVHVQMHAHNGAQREHLREIELDEEEDLSEL